MAFRLIDHISGIMKSAGSDCFLEMFESTYVTAIRYSPFLLSTLTHTYCSAMMVYLKCASMYGMIGGMRKHDIDVGEVVVRKGRYRCFDITPNRITHPVGISRLFCLPILIYRTGVCTACQCHQTVAVFPAKQLYHSVISRYLFPALSFSLLTRTTFFFT